MQPRKAALCLSAALILGLAVSAPPAGAAETGAAPAENYAAILRTINPDLQVHESRAYARSVLADSQRSNVDPALIVALVSVESSWRPGAVSPSGARGLAQLMPTTAAHLHVNPWDPSQNLRGASAYLRSLIDRFAGRGVNAMRDAIGAYNAGPHAVEKYRGIPPYYETQHYVVKVLAQWRTLSMRVAKTFVARAQSAAPAADEREWLANADASALPATLPAAVQQP